MAVIRVEQEIAKVHNATRKTRKVMIEQFTTLESAVATLGEVETLRLINYAHGLMQRHKIFREL